MSSFFVVVFFSFFKTILLEEMDRPFSYLNSACRCIDRKKMTKAWRDDKRGTATKYKKIKEYRNTDQKKEKR